MDYPAPCEPGLHESMASSVPEIDGTELELILDGDSLESNVANVTMHCAPSESCSTWTQFRRMYRAIISRYFPARADPTLELPPQVLPENVSYIQDPTYRFRYQDYFFQQPTSDIAVTYKDKLFRQRINAAIPDKSAIDVLLSGNYHRWLDA